MLFWFSIWTRLKRLESSHAQGTLRAVKKILRSSNPSNSKELKSWADKVTWGNFEKLMVFRDSLLRHCLRIWFQTQWSHFDFQFKQDARNLSPQVPKILLDQATLYNLLLQSSDLFHTEILNLQIFYWKSVFLLVRHFISLSIIYPFCYSKYWMGETVFSSLFQGAYLFHRVLAILSEILNF